MSINILLSSSNSNFQKKISYFHPETNKHCSYKKKLLFTIYIDYSSYFMRLCRYKFSTNLTRNDCYLHSPLLTKMPA